MKELFILLIALPIAMVGNILFGMGAGYVKQEFNWEIVKKGFIKNGIVYAGILLYAILGAYLLPNFVVTFIIEGEVLTLSLIATINYILFGAISYYVYDGIKKLSEVWKVKSKDLYVPIQVETEYIPNENDLG
jgi:hypothetical protein